MTRNSMLRKVPVEVKQAFVRPDIPQHIVDWKHLVTIDFETYYDADYSLSKLSTSEYVRDPRFKIQMMGLKIGHGKTRIVGPKLVASTLAAIDWSTHALLCHNTLFDGFILGDRFDIHPHHLYDTLAMARGLHSNEIGAGLDEASRFYGGEGKLEGKLEATKGVKDWPLALFRELSPYCANDVNETLRIFNKMLPQMPAEEIAHIDWITRCFTSPVLKVDLPLVQTEYERELRERDELMYAAVNPNDYDVGGELYDSGVLNKQLLKTKVERALEGKERDLMIIKRVIGSNRMFAQLLVDEGVSPPTKTSPAYLKKPPEERDPDKEFVFAFSKTDRDFLDLASDMENWGFDMENPEQVKLAIAKQARLTDLINVRLAVKSTTNITRAERFLKAGENGKCLPVGYSYYRAHTGRLGGNNKMNMQNLKRGGKLREAILAPDGQVICVVDSGQIEARQNAQLWGQEDLLDDFRAADKWDKSKGTARGGDRDAYCKFADLIYPDREITTEDKLERFVGKVCVLGLGYQMGGPKLQITLAAGALGGPPVIFDLTKCYEIVNAYRIKNNKIKLGWERCQGIIRDMHLGTTGAWGPLNWEKDKIWLPNGMALKYPDLRCALNGDFEEWTYQSGDMRKKIYGGLLCENIVQALARIVVFSQTLEINKLNRIVLSTHDEVGALAPVKQAQKTLDRMMRIMRTAPPWCRTMPLNCEGGYAVNYSK